MMLMLRIASNSAGVGGCASSLQLAMPDHARNSVACCSPTSGLAVHGPPSVQPNWLAEQISMGLGGTAHGIEMSEKTGPEENIALSRLSTAPYQESA